MKAIHNSLSLFFQLAFHGTLFFCLLVYYLHFLKGYVMKNVLAIYCPHPYLFLLAIPAIYLEIRLIVLI